ncbi:acyl-CoA dehydrogenase family protein [Falsigemmobacter intermedius]|uniref:acyl-CoA dehydrogenase family protein n=1 Tax=Falsigemmobacter intermedius TaxID=1553448 RepID=UPI003F1128B7
MSLLKRRHLTPDHEAFRDSVRRWAMAELTPHVEAWRSAGAVSRDAYLSAGAQGYLLMWAPEDYGGLGLTDQRYDQVLQEEVIRHSDPGFYQNLHSQVVGPYLGNLGSEELKARLMPRAISGECILAVAMTEPNAGSDLANLKTRAVDCGDHWEISGQKTYISNGILADAVVVAARTDIGGRRTLGLFMVERGMEGLSRGQKLRKLGLDAQDTAELFFDRVKVPKSHVLGDPAEGFVNLARHLANERLHVAIGSLAHAQTAFDLTMDYITSRQAFGQPIGSFQESRFVMARLRVDLDVAQAFVDACVMAHNDRRLSAEVAAEAKLQASELEQRVISACLQLHGGAGYMEEYRISRMFRDARIAPIYGGTSEIMKEIISRGMGLDARRLT